MVEPLALAAALGLFLALVLRLRGRRAGELPAISSLRPGWAEARGRVTCTPAPRLRAPISDRQVLGWRVVIEQESGVRGWETIVERSECVDFELRDDSGAIEVRAADSPIVLEVAERRGQSGPFAPAPGAVERLIAAHADPRGVLFHKRFRWREWALEDGREIVVRARVVSETSDEPRGYRKLAEQLVLAGGSTRPLELVEP